MEHPNTILAMAHLAATYQSLGKYTESEKLKIQVLDARNRIFGVEHPHTILAMRNLATTLCCLGKYKEAQKLLIQAQELKSKVPPATTHNVIATMATVHEAPETPIMNVEKKVCIGTKYFLTN